MIDDVEGAASTDQRLAIPDVPGAGWLRADWIGTAIFVITAVAAAISPSIFAVPAVVVALTLCAVGCVVFLWAFAIGVDRSRTENVSVAGLYFLSGGVAPAPVRWHFWAALVVQIVVAVATAAVRPLTSLAFGILVPVFGLGLMGRWAAEHGRFEALKVLRTKRKRTGEGSSRG